MLFRSAQPYLAVSEVPPVPSNPVRPPDVSTSSAYSVESFKRRFLTFDGRIGWQDFILNAIGGWVMAAAIMFLGGFAVGIYESITGEFVSGSSFWWFLTFFAGFLAGFWIQFASGARRLHDIRESGWM